MISHRAMKINTRVLGGPPPADTHLYSSCDIGVDVALAAASFPFACAAANRFAFASSILALAASLLAFLFSSSFSSFAFALASRGSTLATVFTVAFPSLMRLFKAASTLSTSFHLFASATASWLSFPFSSSSRMASATTFAAALASATLPSMSFLPTASASSSSSSLGRVASVVAALNLVSSSSSSRFASAVAIASTSLVPFLSLKIVIFLACLLLIPSNIEMSADFFFDTSSSSTAITLSPR
mmetsp:Transcript_22735/g.47436  ORF Transcript_22735/g.47436 Transcript_22735/m.47436 type:complete len:243 (+) Transcript_22735:425-1153(+)